MGSKKIRKLVAKFDVGHKVVKSMGLPSAGDILYGSDRALSPAETATKQAKELAQQTADLQDQEMNAQLDQANQATAQSALQIQSANDREAASAAAQESGQIAQERPTVELADVAAVTNTRKKYRGQIGSSGSKGTSVRV